MKFRKKPELVDAVQWFPGIVIPGVEERKRSVPFFEEKDVCSLEPPYPVYGAFAPYGTTHWVCPGDWIITGSDALRWVCDKDSFERRYEPAEEPKPTPELETLARETADNIFAEEAKEYGKDRADIILSALQQVAEAKDAVIVKVSHENEVLTVALAEALTQGKAEITRLAAQCAHLEAENALLLASQPPPPEPMTDTATTIPPGSTPCVELAELQSLLAQSSRDYVEQAKGLAELAAENDCLRKALARYNPKETP